MSGSRSHSAHERKVFLVGGASLLVAAFSYGFAWQGGLWAIPLSLALAVVASRGAWRRRASAWAKAALVMASLAVGASGFAFASTGGVQPALRTDSPSYLPGDVVGVRLKAGILYVGYNLCFGYATLEQFDGDSWNAVDVHLGGRDQGCTAELRMLGSLLGARGRVQLPRDLPAGAYRLAYELEVDGEMRKFATEPFAVHVRDGV